MTASVLMPLLLSFVLDSPLLNRSGAYLVKHIKIKKCIYIFL